MSETVCSCFIVEGYRDKKCAQHGDKFGVAQPSPQPRCDHDPYDICDNCADGESEQPSPQPTVCKYHGTPVINGKCTFPQGRRVGESEQGGNDVDSNRVHGRDGILLRDDSRNSAGKAEVASPSAALSAYRFWMNYENGPKEPNQEWMQFAEAYAAHSGSRCNECGITTGKLYNCDCGALTCTDCECRHSGSQPSSPDYWLDRYKSCAADFSALRAENTELREQIVSLTEQIKAKDEHSEALQKYVVSLTQERDQAYKAEGLAGDQLFEAYEQYCATKPKKLLRYSGWIKAQFGRLSQMEEALRKIRECRRVTVARGLAFKALAKSERTHD